MHASSFLDLVKEQALINEQFFFFINLINGPSPLPPFSLAAVGRSSSLIGMFWADGVEWVHKRTLQKPYIKIVNSFCIVLRGSFFFPNYFQWQRGVFFVSHNLFSYYNDLNKLQNSKYMGPSCLVWVGCVCLSKDLKYGISILFDIFDKIGLKPVLKLPDDVWKDMTWFKK